MRAYVPAIAAGLIALAVTRLLVVLAPRLNLVDVPNDRSLHVRPVATVGGVGLLAGVVAAICLVVSSTSDHMGMAGLAWASVLLLVFVVDERKPMLWTTKLALQVVASALVLWWTNALLPAPAFAFPLTLVFLCYVQNVYNFMDGLDGFSGLVGCAVGLSLYALFCPVDAELGTLSLAVAAASLGFVVWNLPPARIFMGDVGSHFLGLCFGWIALAGESHGVPYYVSLLPLVPFLYDATYTLARRAIRGLNITQAHRFHLYQRMRRSGWSPWAVDGVYVLWVALCGGAATMIQAGEWIPVSVSLVTVSCVLLTVLVEILWSRSREVE